MSTTTNTTTTPAKDAKTPLETVLAAMGEVPASALVPAPAPAGADNVVDDEIDTDAGKRQPRGHRAVNRNVDPRYASIRVPVSPMRRNPSIGRLVNALARLNGQGNRRYKLTWVENFNESRDNVACGFVAVSSSNPDEISRMSVLVRAELDNLMWDEKNNHELV